jgi:hypothetical protein
MEEWATLAGLKQRSYPLHVKIHEQLWRPKSGLAQPILLSQKAFRIAKVLGSWAVEAKAVDLPALVYFGTPETQQAFSSGARACWKPCPAIPWSQAFGKWKNKVNCQLSLVPTTLPFLHHVSFYTPRVVQYEHPGLLNSSEDAFMFQVFQDRLPHTPTKPFFFF